MLYDCKQSIERRGAARTLGARSQMVAVGRTGAGARAWLHAPPLSALRGMWCMPSRHRLQKVGGPPSSSSDRGLRKAASQPRTACAVSAEDRKPNMKLDDATFRQLRRLAPVLDDLLNAG